MDTDRKLAVYGFINEGIGGLCSGHFLAIKSLADSGYNIIFIEMKGWLEAGSLTTHPNVKCISITPVPSAFFMPFAHAVLWLQKKSGFQLAFFEELIRKLARVNIGRQIGQHLKREKVRVLLVAGFQNYWRLPGIRVISWTQGAILGEGSWLFCHPFLALNHYGIFSYLKTVFGYSIKAVIDRIMFGRSAVILCTSQWSKNWWTKWGCNSSRVQVIPYAYAEKPPRIWKNEACKKNKFLHLGRIVPRKRLELLLEAFSDPRLKDCSLTVVGQFIFPKAQRLLNGLPQNISYKSQVEFYEVDNLIRSHKFLIQASENENLGSSVMEAMVQGVPVILNRQNGTADYVPNEEWHFFDNYEKESLIGAVLRAVETTREMECDWKARANHKKLFSPEAVGAKLSNIVDELINTFSRETISPGR